MISLESQFLGEGPSRLHVLTAGAGKGEAERGPAVCLVHGNLSTAQFFASTAEALPSSWRVAAPDLRGFGRSGAAPVDATRGVRDFADDLDRVISASLPRDQDRSAALGAPDDQDRSAALGAPDDQDRPAAPGAPDGQDQPVHLVGWSLGGGVVMQYAIDHPERVASVTLIAPVPPRGYGGSKGAEGTMCFPDGAGSGAGVVNAEMIARIAGGDRGDESPVSPRSVLRSLYVRPPLRFPAAVEDLFVDEIIATAVGDDNYPGDARPSPNWPGAAPGTRGVVNALSPLYCDLSAFAKVAARRPVLWVHGSDDLIVSDAAATDVGALGAAGIIPGWPGDEFPPQPMVTQTRAMLERARAEGGSFTEEVFDGCGHSPHLEQPGKFRELFTAFVTAAEATR
jgi:pimeloyl-ACP methyl ester carboxylesterase